MAAEKPGKVPARFKREEASIVDRISQRLERVQRSATLRADASRALERLGEAAIQVVTLVGTGVARDDATLAQGLALPPEEAAALAAKVEEALRSVMSRDDG
jgi:hypothetical protein